MNRSVYWCEEEGREVLWAGALSLVNFAVLWLVGRLDSPMGTPVRVHEFAMLGISAGHLCLAIFAMSFAHLRGLIRFPLCNLLVLTSVWTCHLGLYSLHEFFRRSGANILANHQVFFVGGLWVGYALFVALRAVLRLEFGLPQEGMFLPPRSLQFRITALAFFSLIVGICCVIVQMLVSLYLQSNQGRVVSAWEIGLPFAVLGSVLLTTAPMLFAAFLRRRAGIWIPLAIVWGSIPIYVMDPRTMPFYCTLYGGFWTTVAVNLLCLRWIGFRWLPTASTGG